MTPHTALTLYAIEILSYWALAALLWHRRAWQRQLPILVFVAYSAVYNTGLLLVDQLGHCSLQVWWTLITVDSVVARLLAAWVAVSLMWDVYYHTLTLNRRLLSRWLFAIPALAIVGALIHPKPPLLTLDLVANWVTLGCFLIAAMPFITNRVYVGSHSFAIGTGFLLLYLGAAIRSALVSRIGQGDAAMEIAQIAVCALWAWFFRKQDIPVRATKADADKSAAHLMALGRTGIHIVDYGPETLVQWNTQGTGTTFCVRASQIPTRSSILAHEAVKFAEIERHEHRNRGLRAAA